MMLEKLSLPIGADIRPEGGVRFRVWAPACRSVEVAIEAPGESLAFSETELREEDGGYFSGQVSGAQAGMLYRYRLDRGESYPDPASRFQPQGPLGPSQIVAPGSFLWEDNGWPGVKLERQVIYEMHIGTFTPEGTFVSAARELPVLADLGITLVELMPVTEFSGRFGWGYDGV